RGVLPRPERVVREHQGRAPDVRLLDAAVRDERDGLGGSGRLGLPGRRRGDGDTEGQERDGRSENGSQGFHVGGLRFGGLSSAAPLPHQYPELPVAVQLPAAGRGRGATLSEPPRTRNRFVVREIGSSGERTRKVPVPPPRNSIRAVVAPTR